MTVLNTKGFDLPKTGDPDALVTIVCGIAALAIVTRKRKLG